MGALETLAEPPVRGKLLQAVLSVTGSASCLTVLDCAELKPTSQQPMSGGRSGTGTVQAEGENPESREAESVSKKRTTHEGGCSLKSILHTPSSLSLLVVPQQWME